MKIGILGTGMVGTNLGNKFVEQGHEVMLGSRVSGSDKGKEWAATAGPKASFGSFSETAHFGELLVLSVKGDAALEAIKMAGYTKFDQKVLIDLTNPLDFSHGMPPSLFISNTNSLGEEIQKTLPDAFVVKTLNIVTAELMTNPGKLTEQGTMFMAGNDEKAKKSVHDILASFGWQDIIDLGDITGARAMESVLHLWLRLYMGLSNGLIALKLVRKTLR